MLPGVGVPCRVPFSTALDGLGANEPPALPIDLRTQIAAELASLEAEAQLGVELIIAKQGLRIGMCNMLTQNASGGPFCILVHHRPVP